MTDTDLHVTAWLGVNAICVPLFAVVCWRHWSDAQRAFKWRAVLCVILACSVTPSILIEEIGRVTTIDVAPTAIFLAWGALAAFKGQATEFVAKVGFSLVNLFVVWLLLAAIWSSVIELKRRQRK